MKRFSLFIFALLLAVSASAAHYQWSATAKGIVSGENGQEPTAYLWIPENCDKVNALIFAFQNMNEETLFTSPQFRSDMKRLGVGILWSAPGFAQEWDVNSGIVDPFFGAIDSLAVISGHTELKSVPLIAFGHSAQATMPWNFAAWNPQRTLCLISYHGDAPRTNLCGYGRSNIEWGRTRNIDGIPALMVMGEYEWWDARLRPALAFQIMYPGSCISFLGDAGRGHFDLSDRTVSYLSKFIEKSLQNRLHDGKLSAIDPADGWRAQTWEPGQTDRTAPAPAKDYKGCRHESFWYFDEEMARMAEERYAETRGKQPCWLGFTDSEGNLLPYSPKAHCKTSVKITPDKNDEFTISAVYCDSTRTSYNKGHDNSKIAVRYISGPATDLGNNRFRVDRNHPTWDNPRRRGKITLCAEAPSDSIYKETVQEIEITVE